MRGLRPRTAPFLSKYAFKAQKYAADHSRSSIGAKNVSETPSAPSLTPARRSGLKSNNQKLTVSGMKAQIDLRRRLYLHWQKKIPVKAAINKTRKDDILVQLVVAVTRHHQTPWPLYMHGEGEVNIGVHLVSTEMELEKAEEAEEVYLRREVDIQD
ncbi:hypothetical protein BDN70DRAFT_922264 [Pholiota conissans]|uniref:Uncharacterized protein n=1 Tax=Pholiota conissans TaxID=109636 RepID=A0A9P6CSZ9_9AGAR|nr:hypothetical protein BDN70DRAFT_922264 [Pholiota conissans]